MLAVCVGAAPGWVKRVDSAHHFPVPHSVMEQGYLKIRYGRNVYTREVGKGC